MRVAKAALLKPLVKAGLSWGAVRALGFRGLGKAFYSKCAKDAVATDRGHGRQQVDAGQVFLEWHGRSYPHAAGHRVFYRTQDEVAAEIAGAVGCSKATALRLMPGDIKRAKRPEDLCPLCEELRPARLEWLQSTGWVAPHGSDVREAPVATVNEWAASTGRAPRLPAKLGPLVQHEKLKELLHQVRENALNNSASNDTLSVVLDWSAPVEFREFRQTSHSFHQKNTYAMLGACASFPGVEGDRGRSLHYFHGFEPIRGCHKDSVRTALHSGFLIDRCVKRFEDITGSGPQKILVFMDCAMHFRNKVVAQFLCSDALFTARSSVTLVWTAEYHGKTCLDGSFYDAKQWVKTKGDFKPAAGLKSAVEQAYRGKLNYTGLVLPTVDEDRPFGIEGVRRARIPNMAATYSLKLEGRSFVLNHLLTSLKFCKGSRVPARFDASSYLHKKPKSIPSRPTPAKSDATLSRLKKKYGRL